MSTIQAPADISTGRTFPHYCFSGTHRQIGEQFGEACRELIHRHRDKVLSRLGERNGLTREQALEKAMAYRPYVIQYASYFDDEIQGLAHAADLSLAEAYLLQLRAEAATPVLDDDTNECTTFAVQPEATANGVGLVGQNADLPAFYGEIAITAEIRADGQTAVLMVLPAGQVSYIGINDRGLGVFANFVTCAGWRKGFPRYFLSRLALTEATVDGAVERVRSVRRASSRNLIMLDSHGTATDLETTPTREARLDPERGLLAHSNHYVHESLQDEERSPAKSVGNSRVRLQQMRDLLAANHGQLNAERMQAIMRDRTCYPDTLCRMAGDDPDSDTITFASVIAEPSEGRMWVAVGPPNENPYVPLAFSV